MQGKRSIIVGGILGVLIASLVPCIFLSGLIPTAHFLQLALSIIALILGLIIVIATSIHCLKKISPNEDAFVSLETVPTVSKLISQEAATEDKATDSLDESCHNTTNYKEQLQDSIGDIADHSSNITEGIQNITFIMDELAASLGQTLTSIEELNQVAGGMDTSFADMQTAAKENSDYMEEISRKAHQVRLASLDTKNQVLLKAQEMESSMTEKIEASKAVRQIEALTNNILEISDQTNLLALNASIEAAHAGDSGRGFAIVASEITKLADMTSTTATQIQKISKLVIEKVEELAQESANVIEFLNTKTTSGYDKLVETSNNYQNDSKIMFDMMQDFAGAITMLEDNMHNITQSLQAISNSSMNNVQELDTASSTTYQVLSAADETTQLANNSQDLLKNISNS